MGTEVGPSGIKPKERKKDWKIKFFCKPEIFSKNTTAEIRKVFRC
ncbi:hypothetical protein T01_14524 [Trichinella spiralis]|uniref:Uncharacterized protein n=1 Tax=Trichinella spiralis TaxID=6334 RepID=A0A0V1AHZ2_TRISP|nr:hypothetical protein T01_14524 [Trichinella spiralis]